MNILYLGLYSFFKKTYFKKGSSQNWIVDATVYVDGKDRIIEY